LRNEKIGQISEAIAVSRLSAMRVLKNNLTGVESTNERGEFLKFLHAVWDGAKIYLLFQFFYYKFLLELPSYIGEHPRKTNYSQHPNWNGHSVAQEISNKISDYMNGVLENQILNSSKYQYITPVGIDNK
jgi:hypothetical protein